MHLPKHHDAHVEAWVDVNDNDKRHPCSDGGVKLLQTDSLSNPTKQDRQECLVESGRHQAHNSILSSSP